MPAAAADRVQAGSSSSGRRRVLSIALAGVAALAVVFLGTKAVMPHTAPSNPIAAVTSAPGKARAAAAASNGTSAKLNDATGSGAAPTTTTSVPTAGGTATPATAGPFTGPQPNTSRNPFLP